MNKKRVAMLVSVIFLFVYMIPMQLVFADTRETLYVLNEVNLVNRTTDSQLDIDQEQTTSSAIDVTQLKNLITQAQELYDHAVEITTPGTYEIGKYDSRDKVKFYDSIEKAIEVSKEATSQELVNNEIKALERAIAIFKGAKITSIFGDLNGDSKIDVGDLALIAYYYRTEDKHDDWAIRQKADLNKDGVVDLQDLSILSNKLMF